MPHVGGECLLDGHVVGLALQVARPSVTPSVMLFTRFRDRDALLQDEGFRSLRQA